MNEIKRIHLGRQPFVVSVDAYKDLKDYLDAIKQAVGADHTEVIDEVELRMAELLTQKGVHGEKAIVTADIEYLQSQLGNPDDFADDTDEASIALRTQATESATKRLFRDTNTSMVAGVSSGVAAYFGISPLIIRILFVVLAVFWGWGIILYLLLWIVMPEAKTASERLRMQGKPVTVDSLKELATETDISGAAQRASASIAPLLRKIGIGMAVLIGVGFIAFGLGAILSASVGVGYALLYHDDILQFGEFVLSVRDVLFGGAVFVAIASVGAGLVLTGVSAIRRTWIVPGWATASLLAAFFVSSLAAALMGPGLVNKIQHYAEEQRHSVTSQLASYSKLEIVGADSTDGIGVRFNYQQSDTYKIAYSYIGEPKFKDIHTKVTNDNLVIDASAFKNDFDCRWVCAFSGYEMEITVYAPQLHSISLTGDTVGLSIDRGVTQPAMTIIPGKRGWVSFSGTTADRAMITAMNGAVPAEITLTNVRPDSGSSFSLTDSRSTLSRVNELVLNTNRTCSETNDASYTLGHTGDAPFYSNAIVWLDTMPATITVNDMQISDEAQLRNLQSQGEPLANRYRCINIESNRY